MILIVGGESSGKATYARRLAATHGWGEDDMALDVEELLWGKGERASEEARAGDGPLGRTGREECRDSQAAPAGHALPATPELIERLAAKRIVTCAEVGGGVVPLGHEERVWRESVGRLSCELAERATAVVRMVCGIPVVLKGSLA